MLYIIAQSFLIVRLVFVKLSFMLHLPNLFLLLDLVFVNILPVYYFKLIFFDNIIPVTLLSFVSFFINLLCMKKFIV